MANIKNVVKVMNFHSLLRVDGAKKRADKYLMMDDEISQLINIIQHNKNFILDKRIHLPDPSKPELVIYFGSDYGFCANYNSSVNDQLNQDIDTHKVIFGKKISNKHKNVVMYNSRDYYTKNPHELEELIEDALEHRRYSKIYVVYNRYESVTTINIEKKLIYPYMPEVGESISSYDEDFLYDGDIDTILRHLICSYVQYQIKVCDINTTAAENIQRQNSTRESLKRIDELEEVRIRETRKSKRAKEFGKIIENFSKQRSRG